MKIIVYNSKDQYALSRKEITEISGIVPKSYFAPIREFHLTHTLRGSERFEYFSDKKRAFFFFPVKNKSPETMKEAVSELLVGLSRIKSDTRWWHPISELERNNHLDFVTKWHSKCILAIS